MFSASEEELQLLAWSNGNSDAVAMLKMLASISQAADDFVDGDTRSSDRMSAMLKMCLIDLPGNEFYRQHHSILAPIMLVAIAQWNASNEWAHSQSEDIQMFGYVYREALEQIIPVVAQICGGDALEVAKEVNEFYHQQNAETFKEWRKNG